MNSTFNQLSSQIGTWADFNFDYHGPHFGFGEEIGEYTHAILKSKQKIRGFDDPVKLSDACKDALADAGVYLAHWCHIHKLDIKTPTMFVDYSKTGYPLGKLFVIAGQIIDSDHTSDRRAMAFAALQELTNLAAMHGWNLIPDCIEPTWEKVRLRDWRKFPKNGLTE